MLIEKPTKHRQLYYTVIKTKNKFHTVLLISITLCIVIGYMKSYEENVNLFSLITFLTRRENYTRAFDRKSIPGI